MRNLKKLIAVAISLVMLLSVAAISASAAEGDPTLALYGKSLTSTTETGYYELAVHLTEGSVNSVGGIEGTITYDKDLFDYVDVILNSSFVAAGNPDKTSVVANNAENGVVKFVGLTDSTSLGEWFVLRFRPKAAGSATFTLEAQGANTSGYVDVNVTSDSTTVEDATTEDIIKITGSQIKKIADGSKQDIRFRVEFDEAKFKAKYPEGKIKEYGVMMMFTKRLGYDELTYDMIGNPEVVGLAVARETDQELTTLPATFLANLNNMSEAALGVKISARAYIVLDDDETIIYSQNCDDYSVTANSNGDKYVTSSGYASYSVIDVARKAARGIIDVNAAAAEQFCTDEDLIASVETILEQASIKATADRTTLLTFIKDYYDKAYPTSQN